MDEKSIAKGLIYTNENCIGCNKCVKGCPVLGANIARERARGSSIFVDGDKCIHCGKCLRNCEHNAREYHDDFEELMLALKSGETIDLMLAPSFFFHYRSKAHEYTGLLRSLGFEHLYDVSFGANLCTFSYVSYFKETDHGGMISSTCPVVVNYIERYKPELVDCLMPIMSPVACLKTYLKLKNEGGPRKYAFLSPCIGKHDEFVSYPGERSCDYSITFNSLNKYIEDNHINVSDYYGSCDTLMTRGIGAFYPLPGGLTSNISYFMGDDFYYKQIEGEACYPYLNYFTGRFRRGSGLPYLLDIMGCQGGCMQGVASDSSMEETEDINVESHENRYKDKLMPADSPFASNLTPEERYDRLKETYDAMGLNWKMFLRTYNHNADTNENDVSEERIHAVFQRMRKTTPETQNINCTSCGYKSCRDMAIAIAHGYNHPENCVHYMKESLELDRIQMEQILDLIYTDGSKKDSKQLSSEQLMYDITNGISEIESMREQLSNESNAKNRFYASLTHELRTPLNAILSITEQALEDPNNEDLKKNLDTIHSAGEGLLETVNELLDASKLDAGQFTIVNEPYELWPLITEVSNIIRFRAIEKKLSLDLLSDPSLPNNLIGDRKRIRQILINILANAVKYTPEGGVVLRVFWNRDKKNPIIFFSVIDSGIGIKEEDIPYLFSAYKQVDEEKNHHIEGTGLGLYISKSIADEMGAGIEVKSFYGRGTTFTLNVPQKMGEYVPIADVKETVVKEPKPSAIAMPTVKVLLVDDLSVNLQVASRFLDKFQLGWSLAYSAKEALEMCKDTQYDLILMDQQMPEMSGIEAILELRNGAYASKDVPCLIMSADDASDFSDLIQKGLIQGYLAKPINKEEICDAVVEFVSKEKQYPVHDEALPPIKIFSMLYAKGDVTQYLLYACAMERMAASINETQAALHAKQHRLGIQAGKFDYLEGSVDYLDQMLEFLYSLNKF